MNDRILRKLSSYFDYLDKLQDKFYGYNYYSFKIYLERAFPELQNYEYSKTIIYLWRRYKKNKGK